MIQSWRSVLTGLSALLAIAALVLLAAGPMGWRLGWWHYSTGFGTLLPWAGYIGIAAAVAAAPACVAALTGGRRGSLLVGLAALAAGAFAIYMPWQANSLRGVYPPINDISTDMVDPPLFVAALALRKADGGNDGRYKTDAAAQQQKAYPDIAPLKVALAPAQAFARAADTAAAMPGWSIIARDAATGRIEASQSSRWFGFTDDVVIRVSADGAGSRIDVRSVSRHGRGDFGVNAARIRAYLEALEARK